MSIKTLLVLVGLAVVMSVCCGCESADAEPSDDDAPAKTKRKKKNKKAKEPKRTTLKDVETALALSGSSKDAEPRIEAVTTLGKDALPHLAVIYKRALAAKRKSETALDKDFPSARDKAIEMGPYLGKKADLTVVVRAIVSFGAPGCALAGELLEGVGASCNDAARKNLGRTQCAVEKGMLKFQLKSCG